MDIRVTRDGEELVAFTTTPRFKLRVTTPRFRLILARRATQERPAEPRTVIHTQEPPKAATPPHSGRGPMGPPAMAHAYMDRAGQLRMSTAAAAEHLGRHTPVTRPMSLTLDQARLRADLEYVGQQMAGMIQRAPYQAAAMGEALARDMARRQAR